jgi:hypothetical protein
LADAIFIILLLTFLTAFSMWATQIAHGSLERMVPSAPKSQLSLHHSIVHRHKAIASHGPSVWSA